jgi:hypothetical protein
MEPQVESRLSPLFKVILWIGLPLAVSTYLLFFS